MIEDLSILMESPFSDYGSIGLFDDNLSIFVESGTFSRNQAQRIPPEESRPIQLEKLRLKNSSTGLSPVDGRYSLV